MSQKHEKPLIEEEEEEEKDLILPPPQTSHQKKKLLETPEEIDEEDEDEEEEEDEYLFRPDKKSKNSKVIDVEFELVIPSEAYYHSVRALLNQYLDGEEGEELDISGLSD